MGEVYLVQHPRLPRREALKVLPADLSASNEFRERFNREADLAATLYHPHIVGLHDRVSSTHSYGSRWTTSTEPTPTGSRASAIPPGCGCPQSSRSLRLWRAPWTTHMSADCFIVTSSRPISALGDPETAHQRVVLADFGIARSLDRVTAVHTLKPRGGHRSAAEHPSAVDRWQASRTGRPRPGDRESAGQRSRRPFFFLR
jgi:serine/threonine-protein kinase